MNRLGAVLLAGVVLAGGIAWGLGARHRQYDYDEVQRAHSIWMVSQGLRPYHDFLECHPPYFVLLSPLARGIADPGVLLQSLRAIAAAGNLLFLAGLVAAAWTAVGSGRLAAVLGTAVVAFHPAVLDFLLEFRIDGWGYAVVTWSVVRFLRTGGTRRYLEFGAATGIATLLLCPKIALLPPMLVAAELFRTWRATAGPWRALGGYAAGLAVASGLFWGYLAVNGIGVDPAFAYLVKYHVANNARNGFDHGLLRHVTRLPLLTSFLVTGVLAGAFRHLRARSYPGTYPTALAAWLVVQAALVSYPYKQYYAPWLLLASCFLAYLGPLFRALPARLDLVGLAALCVVSMWGSTVAARGFAGSHASRDLEGLLRLLDRIAAPEDRVVGVPPYRPIDRHDTFYVWFNTLDPGGYDTERILEDIPSQSDRVADLRYRAELEAHPPGVAVLLFWEFYPARQREVLQEFLSARAYEMVKFGDVALAVRPDRAEHLRRSR